MKRNLLYGALAASVFFSFSEPMLFAQVQKITDEMYETAVDSLNSQMFQTLPVTVKEHLKRFKKTSNSKHFVHAVRVAQDVSQKKKNQGNVLLTYYSVPAMSELQRLPDAYPLDGKMEAPIRIIMSQDEFEPGSFVLYPFADLGKATLRLTEFKNEKGQVFPSDALDLKVIKVWYQNGNGWYSYFGDTGLKLTPELLLNDEDLILVDAKKEQNYARLTEKDGKVSYQWITPPVEIDRRIGYPDYRDFESFQAMKPNFKDAKTLQPVTLKEGEFKQFFLTAHATSKQAPGLYKGSIVVNTKGTAISIPVSIRVLPFVLPRPCAYNDTNKPFLVSSYSYRDLYLLRAFNGGDIDLAKQQLEATIVDLVNHNEDFLGAPGNLQSFEFEYTVDVLRKNGARKDYLKGGGINNGGPTRVERRHGAKIAKKYIESLGYESMFIGYGDEPGADWVIATRDFFKDIQSSGLKFYIAGGDQVFYSYGYGYDFFNTAQKPENREATRKWNDVGHAWVAWYAVHHIGPENPAFNRRQYGITPYLAGYSAMCNYAHHYGPYNDRRMTYKPMVFAYGTGNGVIDTLGWEGFREGIDDIRYATMLKRLAKEADASPDINIQHAGRIALQEFAEFDLTKGDMAEFRLEMIRHIMNLRKLLNK